MDALLPNGWPAAADDQRDQVLALADQTRRTIAVARGLVAAGRRVELTGLDRGVGLLCAKVLDLPVMQGQVVRAVLQEILTELDAFNDALRSSAP